MGARTPEDARSHRIARRVRVLGIAVDVLAGLVAVAALAGGGLLGTYREIQVTTFAVDDTVATSTTTYPYVLPGIGVAVGGLLVALLLLLFGESARLRAQVVLDGGAVPSDADRPGEARVTSSTVWDPEVQAVTVMATGARRSRSSSSRSDGRPPRKRVLILTEQEKAQLAQYLPPNTDEGWYPDPLDASSLRRWNGRQWTGEQQPIALPPR